MKNERAGSLGKVTTASLFDLKMAPGVANSERSTPVRGYSLALANLIHEFTTERRFGVYHEDCTEHFTERLGRRKGR
jgi:hypothetical protein